MTCKTCGLEGSRAFYDPKSHKWYCSSCPEKPERPMSLLLSKSFLLRIQGRHGGVGKRTTAHDNDISHRKVMPNGEVIRDYGKKSFMGSGYYK
mgnify:CR=1 FL=1